MDDLFKWDQALATERLVRTKTFTEALVPAKVAEGDSTYGFGWNVAQRDDDTYMWHTGNAEGQRAFLGQHMGDRIAIIILTRGDSRRVRLLTRLSISFTAVPTTLQSSRSGDDCCRRLTHKESMPRLSCTSSCGARREHGTIFSEAELNSLGYTLLDRRSNADAIRVFELNVRQFPNSSNALDSLADALSRSGRRAEAAHAYSRALTLDPSNVNARAKLQALKSRAWRLMTAAAVLIVGVSGAWFLLSRRQRAAVTARQTGENT